jgi:uroporphyrinogen-III synthase
VRVIVTRPAAQAAEWLPRLQARGVDAVALPLIDIAAPAESGALAAAWVGLARQQLVVFVSPNAVTQFFAARPPAAAWPDGVPAGAPGPGTTQALRAHGLAAGQIVEPAADSPQFDSEALWRQLSRRSWRGARVLIVRGDGGRDWLADTLRAAGAEVAHVAAYRRSAPVLDGATAKLLQSALDTPQRHLWWFSSSEAIDHLLALAPATAGAASWRRSRAIASHPRIAARARRAGFGEVVETRPALDDVVACIQSIRP